mmetsp:Transcript_11107/g.28156  ORF Transcript_11107/g.28156 Transcript_11107/m.28156 type:complete len:329 (-) Transcript_11107:1380-2366(-)
MAFDGFPSTDCDGHENQHEDEGFDGLGDFRGPAAHHAITPPLEIGTERGSSGICRARSFDSYCFCVFCFGRHFAIIVFILFFNHFLESATQNTNRYTENGCRKQSKNSGSDFSHHRILGKRGFPREVQECHPHGIWDRVVVFRHFRIRIVALGLVEHGTKENPQKNRRKEGDSQNVGISGENIIETQKGVGVFFEAENTQETQRFDKGSSDVGRPRCANDLSPESKQNYPIGQKTQKIHQGEKMRAIGPEGIANTHVGIDRIAFQRRIDARRIFGRKDQNRDKLKVALEHSVSLGKSVDGVDHKRQCRADDEDIDKILKVRGKLGIRI